MADHSGESDRSLLYNQDPGALFSHTEEPIDPAHVDEMVDELAAGGVDILLLNVNMWRTNYPSDVWETWWDGWRDWAESNPPIESEEVTNVQHWHHHRHPSRHWMIEQMERLASQGCDYLRRTIDHCRSRSVTPGVSIRMNDQHDLGFPESQYFSSFYRSNPDLRLETDRSSGLAGLNYEYDAVRDHFIALIEEVVSDYDPAVIELDFLRHVPFFDEVEDSSRGVMTDFVGRVSERCDTSSVDVLARVPATPGAALELGFDVETWSDRDLVDGLIVGPQPCYADWQVPVDRFRERLDECPLYVSIDKWSDSPPDLPRRLIPSEEELLLGIGGAYAPLDVDGLYFFNFFGPRVEEISPEEPRFDLLDRLDRDSELRGNTKRYVATVGVHDRTVSPTQVPFTVAPGESRTLSMALLDEPPGTTFRVQTLLGRTVSTDDLRMRLNGTPLGRPDSISEHVRSEYRLESGGSVPTAVYELLTDRFVPGTNRFVIRNDGADSLTVDGLEIRVEAPDESP